MIDNKRTVGQIESEWRSKQGKSSQSFSRAWSSASKFLHQLNWVTICYNCHKCQAQFQIVEIPSSFFSEAYKVHRISSRQSSVLNYFFTCLFVWFFIFFFFFCCCCCCCLPDNFMGLDQTSVCRFGYGMLGARYSVCQQNSETYGQTI